MNAQLPYISQPLPPSVKEILSAYAAKGDGDRDVLLAILHAKTAEDQRIAAIATLNDHVVLLQHQALEASLHQHMLHQCYRPLEPSTSYSTPRSHNHTLPSPPTSEAHSPSPRFSPSSGTSRKRKQSESDREAGHRVPRFSGRDRESSILPSSPAPAAIASSSPTRSSRSPRPSSRRSSGQEAFMSEFTPHSSSRRPMDIHNMLGPSLSQPPSRVHSVPLASSHASSDRRFTQVSME